MAATCRLLQATKMVRTNGRLTRGRCRFLPHVTLSKTQNDVTQNDVNQSAVDTCHMCHVAVRPIYLCDARLIGRSTWCSIRDARLIGRSTWCSFRNARLTGRSSWCSSAIYSSTHRLLYYKTTYNTHGRRYTSHYPRRALAVSQYTCIRTAARTNYYTTRTRAPCRHVYEYSCCRRQQQNVDRKSYSFAIIIQSSNVTSAQLFHIHTPYVTFAWRHTSYITHLGVVLLALLASCTSRRYI
jgi:hypothetical protein